jgi:hypothetical protein
MESERRVETADIVTEYKFVIAELKALISDLRAFQHNRDRSWFSTAEVAAEVGKSSFTAREWCRLGRIHAEKRASGRGRQLEWMVSRDEVQRIRDEGLLPGPASYRHVR